MPMASLVRYKFGTQFCPDFSLIKFVFEIQPVFLFYSTLKKSGFFFNFVGLVATSASIIFVNKYLYYVIC